MEQTSTVVIHFKEVELAADDRADIEKRLERRLGLLAEEFPEITRFEINVAPDGAGHSANAHVNGKNVEVATHASSSDLTVTLDQLMDKIEHQLRRIHDKRIFKERRKAQLHPPKRNG